MGDPTKYVPSKELVGAPVELLEEMGRPNSTLMIPKGTRGVILDPPRGHIGLDYGGRVSNSYPGKIAALVLFLALDNLTVEVPMIHLRFLQYDLEEAMREDEKEA